jgi:hypothetical protein
MAALGAFDFSALGTRTAPLLIVLGSDGDPHEKKAGGYRVGGNSDVYQLLPDGFPFEQVNLSKQFMRQQGRPDMARYECILNLVTDPDQHPHTLETLRKLLRGHRGRVINRPEAVMRTARDQVAKRLAGIDGLRVPKVIRLRNPKPGAASVAAARAGMSFPLIVRLAGTHTGRIIGVVEGHEQLDAACAGRGDFIIIEFVDFRSDDGLYRKYRQWSFGGRAIFRHLLTTDQWNVHVSERNRFMLDRPDLIEEEIRLLDRPEGAFPDAIHAMFRAVQERIGLDFFGMDFAIGRDGRAILFEANATMSFFPLEPHPRFAYLNRIRPPAEAAFHHMLFPTPRCLNRVIELPQPL